MFDQTYLCFQCGEHYYAIEDYKVIRILPARDLYELPIKEKDIKGVIFFEEKIVTIIDIEDIQQETYYILLKMDNEYIGVCANEIIGNYVIKDFEWKYQEELNLPFYYEDHDIQIFHFNLR